MPETPLRDFIQALPKTETHLHIEGALPPELLRRVRPELPAEPEFWAWDFKYRDFAHFEQVLLDRAFSWYTSPERYHEAARMVFAGHMEQNVRYAEVSFASGVVEFGGVDARGIVDAINAAVPPGLAVRVFLGIHHNGFTPKMRPVFEDALSWKGLAGIDLHGAEDVPVDPWAVEYWEAARRAGKYTKAHAGEFMGPEFIRWAIDVLGARRIEHGIRAVEDPLLVGELKRRGIALDVCPISNHKLVPGVRMGNHPIRRLHDAGVRVTVSTDDPISFGNRLVDDYAALAEHCGFTRAELAGLARNGFRVALMPEEERRRHLADLERF